MEVIFKRTGVVYHVPVEMRPGTSIAVSKEYELPPGAVFSEVKDFKRPSPYQIGKGKKCSSCGEMAVFDSF